jgi:hypothetical protein
VKQYSKPVTATVLKDYVQPAAPGLERAPSLTQTIQESMAARGLGLDGLGLKIGGLTAETTAFAVPGQFAPERWPEADEAFSYCIQAAKEWDVLSTLTNKAAVLQALAAVGVEATPKLKDHLALYLEMVRIDQGAERALAKHADGHPYDEDGLTVQGGLTSEMVAENAEDRTAARELLPEAQSKALHAFHDLLGFPTELPDSSIPGRTWLLSWPIMRSRSSAEGADPTTSLSSFTALAVAAPGQIPKEGDTFLACHVEDMVKEDVDRDYQSVSIKAMPVRLSRDQCLAWAKPMAWKGRLLYLIQPDASDEKPRRSRKEK